MSDEVDTSVHYFTGPTLRYDPEAERHNELLRELAGIRLALQSIADALKVAPNTHQQEQEMKRT